MTTLRDDGAPLRILMSSYRSHPLSGGQGVYMRHLTKALVDLGHTVDVVSGPPYPDLDPRVGLHKLPSLDLYAEKRPLLALRPSHLGDPLNLYEWWAHNCGMFPEPRTFGVRFARWIGSRAKDYDILHDNQTLSPGILRARDHGLPVTATLHHPITRDMALALAGEERLSKRALLRLWHSFLPMQMRVARRIGRLITISENSKRDFARDFGLDRERITVALIGIDAERFKPSPGVTRSDDLIVCTSSADVAIKGLRYLIEAFASLRRKRPQARLHVVGEPRKGPTSDLLDGLGLRGVVEFRRGLSDQELADLYAEAAIVAVPSLYEGFGLPAGEAMAAGAAVVSTTGGALREVVGDAGVLVPPADPRALGEAILALLDDPERRRALGEAGRARVLERFSWTRCAEETARHYRKVIADAHRQA